MRGSFEVRTDDRKKKIILVATIRFQKCNQFLIIKIKNMKACRFQRECDCSTYWI
jgi:hypothetical protein